MHAPEAHNAVAAFAVWTPVPTLKELTAYSCPWVHVATDVAVVVVVSVDLDEMSESISDKHKGARVTRHTYGVELVVEAHVIARARIILVARKTQVQH